MVVVVVMVVGGANDVKVPLTGRTTELRPNCTNPLGSAIKRSRH